MRNQNRRRNTKTKKKTVVLLAMIMFRTIVIVHCFVSMCGMWYFMMLLVNLYRSFDFHNKKAFPESQSGSVSVV